MDYRIILGICVVVAFVAYNIHKSNKKRAEIVAEVSAYIAQAEEAVARALHAADLGFMLSKDNATAMERVTRNATTALAEAKKALGLLSIDSPQTPRDTIKMAVDAASQAQKAAVEAERRVANSVAEVLNTIGRGRNDVQNNLRIVGEMGLETQDYVERMQRVLVMAENAFRNASQTSQEEISGSVIKALTEEVANATKASEISLNILKDARSAKQKADYEAEAAKARRNQEENAKKLAVLIEKAEQGDLATQFQLAELYAKGTAPAQKNQKEAEKWFLQAAEHGHAESQYRLFQIKVGKDAEGYVANNAESLHWLEKAAKQGHQLAQVAYIRYFTFELKDQDLATQWMEISIAAKNAEAIWLSIDSYMGNMGEWYTKVNVKRALELLGYLCSGKGEDGRAIEMPTGIKCRAMIRLGDILCEGKLTGRNYKEGLRLAREGGKLIETSGLDHGSQATLYGQLAGLFHSGTITRSGDYMDKTADDIRECIRYRELAIKHGKASLDQGMHELLRSGAEEMLRQNQIGLEASYTQLRVKVMETENPLLGLWEGRGSAVGLSFEFFDDGTYRYRNDGSGMEVRNRYSFTDTHITMYTEPPHQKTYSISSGMMQMSEVPPESYDPLYYAKV